MAIRPVDTKTVYKADIDGTIFHIRAWRWFENSFWESVRFRMFNDMEVHQLGEYAKQKADETITEERAKIIIDTICKRLTKDEAAELTDNIAKVIVRIDGIEDCLIDGHQATIREFIDGMDRSQIMELAAKIYNNSSLDEAAAKNSESSCDSAETTPE